MKHSSDTSWIAPEDSQKVVEAILRRRDKESKLQLRQEGEQRKITEKDFATKTVFDLLLEFYDLSHPDRLSAKSQKRVTSVRSLYTDIGGVMRHLPPRIH